MLRRLASTLTRPLTKTTALSSAHLSTTALPSKRMLSTGLPTISLTGAERELATHLVECTNWIQNNPHEVDALRLQDDQGEWIGQLRDQKPVELRVAGGWVRDKLLGLDSDDIDISVSPAPLTGLKFATLFEAYLTSIGKRDIMGKLTKIEAKPDQSKHLETATAHVCGLSVDWVQQRGHEIYTSGSRIPTVSFGTPLEDAQRRDLTINALFYNLNTQQIEDQTGCGIPDLGLSPPAPKRIRTPLEPFQTFHDDPLRVVRAVRFAARFGREFEVDEALRAAIGREEIRAALRDPKKISRERVGIELEKMMLGKDPLYALELIDQLNMHDLVFLYDPKDTYPSDGTPQDGPGPEPDTSITVRAANILAKLLSPVSSTGPALPPRVVTALAAINDADPTAFQTTTKRLYLATALLPLYDLNAPDKKKVVWVGEKVVHAGIKWSNPDRAWQVKAREASKLLAAGVAKYARGTDPADRGEIGLLLRDANVQDVPHTRWEVSLLWSLVVQLTRANGDAAVESELVSAYNQFVNRVLEYELETLAFLPPLLIGSDINALLPTTRNSPAMVHITRLVVRWQLAHPDRNKEQCEAWLTTEAEPEVMALCERFKKPAYKKKQNAP